MNIVQLYRFAARRLTWLALGAALVQCSNAAVREETFDVLQTKTRSYTNVTVTTKTKSYIFVMHASGMGNIPLADLPTKVLQKLGYAVASDEAKTNSLSVSINRIATSIHLPPVKSIGQNWRKQLPAMAAELNMSSNDLYTAMAIVFAFYLFSCYCLGAVCRKAESDPGFLIWLPVFQLFPLLRAAKMSNWWFVMFCLPVLNLLAHVTWCINIVKARRKSPWVALFLWLPVTGLFALLYLAFSRSTPVLEAPRYKSMALQTA